MPVPVKVSDKLMKLAKADAQAAHRSATAQIEHWAKLGRVLDSVLSGKSIAHVKQLSRVDDLDAILAMTQTPAGQAKARAVIAKHKGPIYTADPERPDVILEKLPDGTTRSGRFINRQFVPALKRRESVTRKRSRNRSRAKSAAPGR